MTLLIELSSILILFNRQLSSVILFGFILLHFFIFIFSGIFFWKWMLLNLFLIILIYRLDLKYSKTLFSRPNFILSVLLILLSPIYLNPLKLGWIDSNLNNFYDIKLVGESGRVYNVSRDFMSPYDIIFSQNRFYFLNKEAMLVDTYGTCFNIDTCDKLRKITERSVLEKEINSLQGKYFYNKKKIGRFNHFIKVYFTNLNLKLSKDIIINRFSPPFHINNFSPNNTYNFQEKVVNVLIVYIRTFYDGNEIHYLNNRVIDSISISN